MAKASQTTKTTPSSWDEFPDLKIFWDAWVDIFWGQGGNTSYHAMLLEDEEWLRNAYLQNNEALTALEQQYVSSVSDTAQQYEQGMQAGVTSMGLGNQRMNFVPRATQRSLESLKANRNEAALAQLAGGQQQAGRIMDYAKGMPPNVSNMAYMNQLQQLGMAGQSARLGLPTTTTDAKFKGLETPISTQIQTGLNIGTSLLDFGIKLVDSGAWNKIADWEIWDSILGGGGGSGSNTGLTNNFGSTQSIMDMWRR